MWPPVMELFHYGPHQCRLSVVAGVLGGTHSESVWSRFGMVMLRPFYVRCVRRSCSFDTTTADVDSSQDEHRVAVYLADAPHPRAEERSQLGYELVLVWRGIRYCTLVRIARGSYASLGYLAIGYCKKHLRLEI